MTSHPHGPLTRSRPEAAYPARLAWQTRANCLDLAATFDLAGADHDHSDVAKLAIERARQACMACEVLAECDAWIRAQERGANRHYRGGFWAGLTAWERWDRDRKERADG